MEVLRPYPVQIDSDGLVSWLGHIAFFAKFALVNLDLAINHAVRVIAVLAARKEQQVAFYQAEQRTRIIRQIAISFLIDIALGLKYAGQVDRDIAEVIRVRRHRKRNLAASTRVQRACGLVVEVRVKRHGHAIGRIQAGDSMLFLGRALVIAHVRVRFALARGS